MNLLRITDSTGIIAFLILLSITAILVKKKSRLLHSIHRPFTVIGLLLIVIHTVTSLMIGKVTLPFVLVFGGGVLSAFGIVASVIIVIRKRSEARKQTKLHIILAMIALAAVVLHIASAEMLL